MGRTVRKRKKVKYHRTINVSSDPVFQSLSSWLKSLGFSSSPPLRPALFKISGRGLQSLSNISSGEDVVNIPLSAVISRGFVVNSLSQKINQIDSFPTQALLSLWLLKEKSLGSNSKFLSYIDSLPTSYTNPYFCSQQEKLHLPQYLFKKVQDQECQVTQNYERIKGKCESLSWSLKEWEWAWFTVNTRAVFLEFDPRFERKQAKIDSDNCLALVPYLDLLNHSSEVEVTAGLNSEETHYRIVTHSGVRKYEQAFINYGPHDNTKLLVEYGFWIPGNHHEMFSISLQEILEMLVQEKSDSLCNQNLNKKVEIINKYCLTEKLAILKEEGVTWNLMMVMKILHLDFDQLSDLSRIFDDSEGCDEVLKVHIKHFVEKIESKLQNEYNRMVLCQDGGSESFKLCLSLVHSHLDLVGKAKFNI